MVASLNPYRYGLPFLATSVYTEIMEDTPHFELPKELLTRLDECTRGYFLVVINDMGEFEVHDNVNDQADSLAITRFLEEYLMMQDEEIMSDMFDKKPDKASGEDKGDAT